MALAGQERHLPDQQIAAFFDYLTGHEPSQETCWEAWKQMLVVGPFLKEFHISDLLFIPGLLRGLVAAYRHNEPLTTGRKQRAQVVLQKAKEAAALDIKDPQKKVRADAFFAEMEKVLQ